MGTFYALIKWYNHRQKNKVEHEIKYNGMAESIEQLKEGHQKIIDKLDDGIRNIKDLKEEQDHIVLALTLTSLKFKKLYDDIKKINK